MKSVLLWIAMMVLATGLCAAGGESSDEQIVVRNVRGDVSVRHGVTDAWMTVAVGDVLKPDDTMKTGKKGSAVIVATLPDGETISTKKITLPSEVIVDISDIRHLTPEELMLKLTMEKVRSSSYEWKSNDLHIPNAAVVHGADRAPAGRLPENADQTGILSLNGTHVLYDNGFYSTCALKAMEVFRLYPALAQRFADRMMVAQALEKADLKGEALNEYASILQLPGLSAEQQAAAKARLENLKR